MDKNYTIAGHVAPPADTDTTLFTVAIGRYFVASTLVVTNRDKTGDAAEFRIAVVPKGEVLANKHFIKYDDFIDQRESISLTLGIALPAEASVIVRSSTANLSFSLFGVIGLVN